MDLEAVGWRPARRLRHVTAVCLHNLYDPAFDGASGYFYELCTWDAQQWAWSRFYRSEQLANNRDLDWARQRLDPDTETMLQGVHHRPDVGPLRLRVYATCNDSTAPKSNSTTVATTLRPSSGSWPVGQNAADAAAAADDDDDDVLPNRSSSDYEAQHLPRLRRQADCCIARNGVGMAHVLRPPLQPSPPPLPLLPQPHTAARLSPVHVSAAGDSSGTAGNDGVSGQCWEQSRLGVGLGTICTSTEPLEAVVERSWGKVSGPGPPSLQLQQQSHQQPDLQTDITSAFGAPAAMQQSREGSGGEDTYQGDKVQLGQGQRQGQGETKHVTRQQGDVHMPRERDHQRQQQQQEVEKEEQQQQQQEQDGRYTVVCAGSLRAQNPAGACPDADVVAATAEVMPAPPASPGGPNGTCSSGPGPGASSACSGSSSRSRSSDFGAVRKEVSAGQLSNGGGSGPGSCEADIGAVDVGAASEANCVGGNLHGRAAVAAAASVAAVASALPQLLDAPAPPWEGSRGNAGGGQAAPDGGGFTCRRKHQEQEQEPEPGQGPQPPRLQLDWDMKMAPGVQRQTCEAEDPVSVRVDETDPQPTPPTEPAQPAEAATATGPSSTSSSSSSTSSSPACSLSSPSCPPGSVTVGELSAVGGSLLGVREVQHVVVCAHPTEVGCAGGSGGDVGRGGGGGVGGGPTPEQAALQEPEDDGGIGHQEGGYSDVGEQCDGEHERYRMNEERYGGDEEGVRWGEEEGSYDGGDGSGDGGGMRLLVEHVFELRELVFLDPRMLRHGWYINLPLLLMEPGRQPFVPPCALPPPPPPPRPPPVRQPPSSTAPAANASGGGGGGGGGPSTARWRFGALHGGSGGGGSATGWLGYDTTATNGDRGAGGLVRGASSWVTEAVRAARVERSEDDKRALLRWLLSSSSVVQPLQAVGSLEEELQNDDFLASAAAAAEPAATSAVPADGRHLHSPHLHHAHHVHLRPPALHHTGNANPHQRSLSAADAAALLDPGPIPGFLPSALAVLFRQEWPWGSAAAAAAAIAPPAGPPGLRQSSSRQGLEQPLPPTAATPAAAAAASERGSCGRASPGSRRVASTPSLAVVAEVEADAEAAEVTVDSAPGAGRLAGSAATLGSLLRPSGGSAGDFVRTWSGGDADSGSLSAPASPSSSAVSYIAAAAAAAAATLGGPAAASSLASDGGSQTSLTSLAGGRAASPSLPSPSGTNNQELPSEGLAAVQHSWLPAALLPPRRPASRSLRPFASSGQLTGGGAAAGGGGSGGAGPTAGLTAGDSQPPLIDSAAAKRGPAAAAAAVRGRKRAPLGRGPAPQSAAAAPPTNHYHNHHNHHNRGQGHNHQPYFAAAAAATSTAAAAVAPSVQRLCELVEVRANIGKLTQLQERLTATRAGALGVRRRLEAAAERRHLLDDVRARAEAVRVEGRGWSVRVDGMEAQLRAMRAEAVRRRHELHDRARALETAARVLQAAEQRRLSALEQLEGPSGRGHLAELTAALAGRRNRLVSELGRIFQIGPISESLLDPDPLDQTLDSSWAGEWARTAGDWDRQTQQHPQPQREEKASGGKQGAEEDGHPGGGGGGGAEGGPQTRQGGEEERAAGQQTPEGTEGAAMAVSAPSGSASLSGKLRGSNGGGGGGGGGPALGGGRGGDGGGGPTRLAIMGLELPPNLIERSLHGSVGWSPLDLGRRYDADQRTAAGLGYLAAIVDLAATYLGVPLRYPIAPRVSVSYISDPVPPSASVRSGAAAPVAAVAPLAAAALPGAGGAGAAAAAGRGAEWRLLTIATGSLNAVAAAAGPAPPPLPAPPPFAVGLIPGPRGVGVGGRLAVFSSILNANLDPWVATTPAGAVGDDAHPVGLNPAAGLPLFWGDGARDRTRFAYAVYLLSKDVEQLLESHGIPPIAPNQPLPNLYVLISAAASGVSRRAGRGGGGVGGVGGSGTSR